MKNEKLGPKIYNIFPPLLGKIINWESHIERIQKMKFDWIYINPINEVGFSGSLYSIKNYFKLNPIFAENEEDQNNWHSFRQFIEKCHSMNIKIMIDLVINHTAVDAVKDHEMWYKKKWAVINKLSNKVEMFFNEDDKPTIKEYPEKDFEIKWQVANAYAINPQNSKDIVIWGDLVEIDFNSPAKQEILTFFKKFLDFNLNMGIDGFRCDAAYQIAPEIWNELIRHIKNQNPDIMFWAETLGATMKQYRDICDAGFDYITTSAKWWDFTNPWCIDQYNEFRKFSPAISFPENHDTHRLAAETNKKKELQIFRYLFSAFFSKGVMITLGYEFGFIKKTHVVETKPSDWEEANFDITKEIEQINNFKEKYYCLNEDGELFQFNFRNLGILFLRKTSIDGYQQILLINNKDWNNEQQIYITDLRHYFDYSADIYQLFIDNDPKKLEEFSLQKNLAPNEYLIFMQEKQ